MNTDIVGHLLETGFKPFRRVHDEEIPCTNPRFISSVDHNIYVYFKKEDKVVVYGMSEYGKPPTIVYPRISYYKNVTFRGKLTRSYQLMMDDDVNKFIQNNGVEKK